MRSNFGGFTFPLLAEKSSAAVIPAVAVEPTAAPTLTEGRFDYDLGDQAGMTLLMPMYTPGPTSSASSTPAGCGYHGDSPLGVAAAQGGPHRGRRLPAVQVRGGRSSPAPRASSPPRSPPTRSGPIDEALRCKEEGRSETIVFNLCGHGHFDLKAYEDHPSEPLDV